MTDTPLPEGNPESLRLFGELEHLINRMRAHRPDDLIEAANQLITAVEQAPFPELYKDDAGEIRCPYCRENILDDEFDVTNLRAHDYDIDNSAVFYTPTDGDDPLLTVASNDKFRDAETWYFEHECGGAVRIPSEWTVTFG
jgi:hypothetical protein